MIKNLCFIFCFAALVNSSSIPEGLRQIIIKSRKSATIQNELVFVGQVHNKAYYAQKAENMNWADAKELCVSHGMALATVETAQELQFMKNVDLPDVFDTIYWSAARDSLVTSQFRWDQGPMTNRTEIMEEIPLLVDPESPPSTCCAVVSWMGYFYMIPTLCDSRTDGWGALCQSTL